MSRPIPMLDDLALDAVLYARQRTRGRFVSVPVAGLSGDVQQELGRASHEIEIWGVLVGDEAFERLNELQESAASGEEVTFTADITTALELDKVIIVEAEFSETAGKPGRYEYRFLLRESPPLPEPATLDPFGGLEDFDTDILGDIADMAGDLQDGMDMLNDVLGDLEALSALSDLSLGNPVEPMQNQVSAIADAGESAVSAGKALANLLGGD